VKLACFLFSTCTVAQLIALPETFPGEQWERPDPVILGVNGDNLKRFAKRVGGDGCIVKDGYLIHEWGNISLNRDWASASKPVLSTMLLLTVAQKKVPSVNHRLAELGWALEPKDQEMTLLQLANMTSGYHLIEKPGAAYAYNDFGIQLLAESLEKIYSQPLNTAALAALAPLKFQDGVVFGSRNDAGAMLSPRDMARLGWFWLQRGRWENLQLIPQEHFTENVKVQVPASMALSEGESKNYLGLESYGGTSNQTAWGPGVYGFCFWFNGKLPSGERMWPSAPEDTFQANGSWNRHTVTVIPSLKMVIVVSKAENPGSFHPGKHDGPVDRYLKLLVEAVPAPKAKAPKAKSKRTPPQTNQGP
jgi:CubicO group peptidase (beta-lactamase class C family)